MSNHIESVHMQNISDSMTLFDNPIKPFDKVRVASNFTLDTAVKSELQYFYIQG